MIAGAIGARGIGFKTQDKKIANYVAVTFHSLVTQE